MELPIDGAVTAVLYRKTTATTAKPSAARRRPRRRAERATVANSTTSGRVSRAHSGAMP